MFTIEKESRAGALAFGVGVLLLLAWSMGPSGSFSPSSFHTVVNESVSDGSLGMSCACLLSENLFLESLLHTHAVKVEFKLIFLWIVIQIMSFWVHHCLEGL